MTAQIPLTADDCDLRDFAFMPLDVARLRDSELAANETPEACWAAVLLWAASWHQVPAASIPNDDKWLAKHTGYGRIVKEWMKVRDAALRGWVLCSDGRLYHPVVAEKAVEAWKAKLEQRWRTECARIKKHNQRHGTSIPSMQFHDWIAAGRPSGQPLYVPGDNSGSPDLVPGETESKRQGEGEGQGDSISVPKGTAAKAAGNPGKVKSPEDIAKAELWRTAVAVLQEGGCTSESVCRSFMGKLVSDYTFPIAQQAVLAAATNQPADARQYLVATCQRLTGERLNKQESLEQSNAKVAEQLAQETT